VNGVTACNYDETIASSSNSTEDSPALAVAGTGITHHGPFGN
jgi:hypothetical protein